MAFYKVGANDKADPSYTYKKGDAIVTNAGTYYVTGVDSAGSITDRVQDPSTNTYNYTGTYGNADGAGYGGNSASSLADDTSAKTTSKLGAYTDQSDYINDLYDAMNSSSLSKLEAAYNSNVSDLDASEAKIAPYYYNARNQTAASDEQQSANWNEYAAASGLNNGTTGQAALARSNSYQSSMTALQQAEADALASVELQRSKLAKEYSSAILEAKAENNYSKAQALYSEAVRVDENLVDLALQKAQFNYSYDSLYDSDDLI